MNRILAVALAVALVAPVVSAAPPQRRMPVNREAKMRMKIDSLMSVMTLDEKIGQLNLPVTGILTGDARSENIAENIRNGHTGGVFGLMGAQACADIQRIAVEESRLGIPLLFGLDVIHGLETTYPIPLAQAASWNMPLIEEAARAAATEASSMGIAWVFSPMVDVCRDPRWGRIAEGPGEDPYLGAEIARAMVRGYQGKDLADPTTVMACVKHYALYGAPEAGRDYNSVNISRQTAFNEYLPTYRAAAEEGAASYMASFNDFEGIPATANRYLINDVLRELWGFGGFVVTDYTGIAEMVPHGLGTFDEVTVRALEAGIDMDMVSEGFKNVLPKAVAEGKVTEEQIDVACRRILEAKYRLGLFDDPYRYCDTAREAVGVYNTADRDLARRMGPETMVLLKNDSQLLPLEGAEKIAVIGPLGNSPTNMLGMWSMCDDFVQPVSVYEGLKSALGADRVKYAKGCDALDDDELEAKLSARGGLERENKTPDEMRAEALALAAESDVIIAAMGELMEMTGEGASRVDITIPEPQRRLLAELAATGRPIVLVLFTGRPLVLTGEAQLADAILNVWFAGSEAGDAIADVLTGKAAPSGKLPVSFPYHIGQIPVHYNHKSTGRPMPPDSPYIKYRSNYQDIPNEPLYPFGYGLSYTTFEYSPVTLSKTRMGKHDICEASVTVTNTGKRTAKEIVQLYIRDRAASSTRPVMEMKGFEKIELAPGESRTVTFPVGARELSFYNHELDYVLEPGEFDVMIGSASNSTHSALLTVE